MDLLCAREVTGVIAGMHVDMRCLLRLADERRLGLARARHAHLFEPEHGGANGAIELARAAQHRLSRYATLSLRRTRQRHIGIGRLLRRRLFSRSLF